ncbi:hypothetical protein DF186_19085, partial [Enterococcus hirae]
PERLDPDVGVGQASTSGRGFGEQFDTLADVPLVDGDQPQAAERQRFPAGVGDLLADREGALAELSCVLQLATKPQGIREHALGKP